MEILVNGGGDMRKRIFKLVEKQGFIILLFVGVCIVAGITLYVSMRSLNVSEDDIDYNELVILDEEESYSFNDEFNIEDFPNLDMDFADFDNASKEEDEESKEVALMEIGDSEDAISGAIDVAELEDVEGLEFEEDDYQGKAESIYVAEEINVAILPLEGEIITEYTQDTLIYSETLEAWVGHGAIDIKGKEGSPVQAAMKGIIKQVYKDDLWGIVIVIDHGNGLESKYSNLGTMEMVREGLKVEKGDHISVIGKTAKIEMHMEPHLHFEVIKNGKNIDPRSITK